jgi:hypothetical protein
VVNFVSVSPAGPGDLRATPFGTPIPLAAIINYAAVPGLAIANGLAVTICDPAVASCGFDLTIQADNSATDLVADVQGYFRKVRKEQVKSFSVKSVHFGPLVISNVFCTNYHSVTVTAHPGVAGTVLVRGDVVIRVTHTTGTPSSVGPFWGNFADQCN